MDKWEDIMYITDGECCNRGLPYNFTHYVVRCVAQPVSTAPIVCSYCRARRRLPCRFLMLRDCLDEVNVLERPALLLEGLCQIHFFGQFRTLLRYSNNRYIRKSTCCQPANLHPPALANTSSTEIVATPCCFPIGLQKRPAEVGQCQLSTSTLLQNNSNILLLCK